MAVHSLRVLALPGTFAICRLERSEPIPPWAITGNFFAICRTADELSIVCRQEMVPNAVSAERGWRGLRVAGTLDFAAVGILAALAVPLAQADVSLFAVSTFDTDYLFVRDHDFQKALEALRHCGHTVQ
jgi:hypothetical protein